jgi:hypothetical protein
VNDHAARAMDRGREVGRSKALIRGLDRFSAPTRRPDGSGRVDTGRAWAR